MTNENPTSLTQDLVNAMNQNAQDKDKQAVETPVIPAETTRSVNESTTTPSISDPNKEQKERELLIAQTMDIMKQREMAELAARRAADPIAVTEDAMRESDIPDEYRALGIQKVSELLRNKANPTVDDAKWLANEYVAQFKREMEAKVNYEREFEARRELDMYKRYGQEYLNVQKGLIASLEDVGLTQASAKRLLDSLTHEAYQEQVEKYYRTNHLGGKNPYAQPATERNSLPGTMSAEDAEKLIQSHGLSKLGK